MPQANVTHHVTISDVAGTNKTGFILARRRGRDLAYAVADAEQIQPRVLSQGEITEAEAPIQLRMYWSMDDWRAGTGGITDREHKNRLASSTQIDTTARGTIRPAHLFTEDTPSSAASTIIPSAFWTVGTELWAGVGRDVYIWNFDNIRWDIKTEPSTLVKVYRNGTEFEGTVFVPSWATTHDFPYHYIYKRDSDDQMTESTIKKRPKYISPGRDLNGVLALWAGYLHVDTTFNTNEAVDNSETVIDVTPDPILLIDVNDVVGIDDELMLVTARDSTTITVTRGYLGTTAATHDTAKDIYEHLPHGIMSSINPVNGGSWTNPIKVGTIDAEITALVQDGETLIICKTDGIWVQFRDGTIINLTPQFESQQHVDNFRGAFNWNGHIILPLGGSGDMFELFEGQLFDISMKNYAPKVTAWHGQVAAVGGDPTHLYILVDEAANTKYHVLLAEWRSFEGRLDWRWHHIGNISYTTSTKLQYATVFAEAQTDSQNLDDSDPHHRVWFGIHSASSADYGFFYRSSAVDHVFAYAFQAGMVATFPDYDAGFPRISKNCIQVDIDGTNLTTDSTARQWAWEYSLDGAAFKTDLTDSSGNADGINDENTQTLTFPAGTTCKILTLRAIPSSLAGTSTPPEINRIRVTFQLRPDRLRLLPMTFYLADNITLLNGALGGHPGAELAQLRTWDAQAAAVTVTDIEGTARDYVFLPGNMRIRPRKVRPGHRREFLVDVVLAQE